MIALIPARAGSKRLPGKNTRLLAGHPLIAYTIAAAQQSGVFDAIYVSSDKDSTLWLAERLGVNAINRPVEFAGDESPDVEWVQHALGWLGNAPESLAILRPTSPFRTAATIQRARKQFHADIDSLRAVQLASPHRQHPGKQWVYDVSTNRIRPVMDLWTAKAPYHSSPTQLLTPIVDQTACLEMVWTRVVFETNTISGRIVAPFFTEGAENEDLNTEIDWMVAASLIRHREVSYPDPFVSYGR